MNGDHLLLTAEEAWRRYDAIESRLTAPVSEGRRMNELVFAERSQRSPEATITRP